MKATLEFDLDKPVDKLKYEHMNKIEDLLEAMVSFENWISETAHDESIQEYQICYRKFKQYKNEAGL